MISTPPPDYVAGSNMDLIVDPSDVYMYGIFAVSMYIPPDDPDPRARLLVHGGAWCLGLCRSEKVDCRSAHNVSIARPEETPGLRLHVPHS